MATGPILRGTTPPIKIRLKRTDLEVNTIEILELKIWQEAHELIKHLSDVTIDTEDNSINYEMTEEETLAFNTKSTAKIRCRFGIGTKRRGTGVYNISFTGDDVSGLLVDASI
ncbi:MAG: hypothetical protein J6U54_24990 [Clostridiales bacterium]|nr:hypothetical protein [Clostridiales bacterium]